MIVGASIASITGCAGIDRHPQLPERLTYEQACARSGGVVWNGDCIDRWEADRRMSRLREQFGW